MMKFEVVHIEETDSTNLWMKENGVGDQVVACRCKRGLCSQQDYQQS